jgi:hypothetical protein
MDHLNSFTVYLTQHREGGRRESFRELQGKLRKQNRN